jgi:hypothetical protein
VLLLLGSVGPCCRRVRRVVERGVVLGKDCAPVRLLAPRVRTGARGRPRRAALAAARRRRRRAAAAAPPAVAYPPPARILGIGRMVDNLLALAPLHGLLLHAAVLPRTAVESLHTAVLVQVFLLRSE